MDATTTKATEEPATLPADRTSDEELIEGELIEEELLVEEVSIDGMCGVY